MNINVLLAGYLFYCSLNGREGWSARNHPVERDLLGRAVGD